ncbi:MAG: alpha/beta hydrolase [Flavobacteriaceae bacterium]|nr:alpha/beta hydrolase [Flavobacteriaceae bacterium]
MIKNIILLVFILFVQNSFCQVTFIVDNLPKNTSKNASIYISGDFENWTGGQKKYKLKSIDNLFFITIHKTSKLINFKFTQGNWDTVESDKNGNNLGNRNYTFNKVNDTVKIEIQAWSNKVNKKSTASKNVSILSEDFYIPQLNRKRKIWLYLPPDYHNSQKKYPVIYMHDGQNLFDEKTSFSGEWRVDEALNQIFKDNGFGAIVIGIENGSNKRLDEYSLWKNSKYGGGKGDAYIDFIVTTLKPYVDKKFRTRSDKSNTVIFGSSMGGLISFYATLKYPEVFGKSGVFSPSFWFSEQSFVFAKSKGNLNHTKIYFLAGDKEGESVAFDEINHTVKDMNTIVSILKKQGFEPKNIKEIVVHGGKHNEKMWRENFKNAILWLFTL